jgi:hypothetical protein
MTELVPELADLPPRLVLDSELIAFGEDGLPSFPLLCERMLHCRPDIPIGYMIFDLLEEKDRSTMPPAALAAPPAAGQARLARLALADLRDTPRRRGVVRVGARGGARGRRRKEALAALPAGRATVDQGQEPGLLALSARAGINGLGTPAASTVDQVLGGRNLLLIRASRHALRPITKFLQPRANLRDHGQVLLALVPLERVGSLVRAAGSFDYSGEVAERISLAVEVSVRSASATASRGPRPRALLILLATIYVPKQAG